MYILFLIIIIIDNVITGPRARWCQVSKRGFDWQEGKQIYDPVNNYLGLHTSDLTNKLL